jgi:hypothetical protein
MSSKVAKRRLKRYWQASHVAADQAARAKASDVQFTENLTARNSPA